MKSAMKFYTVSYWEDFPAVGTTTYQKQISGILREIYPDEPIQIHRLQGEMGLNSSVGDAIKAAVLRNRSNQVVAWAAGTVREAGQIVIHRLDKEIADTYSQYMQFDHIFPIPLLLDKDDSLNWDIVFAIGTIGAGTRSARVVLNIHYTVG